RNALCHSGTRGTPRPASRSLTEPAAERNRRFRERTHRRWGAAQADEPSPDMHTTEISWSGGTAGHTPYHRPTPSMHSPAGIRAHGPVCPLGFQFIDLVTRTR